MATVEVEGASADRTEPLLTADGEMQGEGQEMPTRVQGEGQRMVAWIQREVQDVLARIKFLDISRELYPQVMPKMKKLFWMEYSTVPAFYLLGRYGFTKLAGTLQVGIMGCSMAVQYQMFKAGRDSESLLSSSTVDLIGSPLQASLKTTDGSEVNASSNKVIKVVGDTEGNFQLRGFGRWCGKKASLKMNGHDGAVLHLRVVDERGSSLLRETSSSNNASMFIVVDQFHPGSFTLAGLPGNDSFELGMFVKSLEHGKTYLKTEDGKYVTLAMGKVTGTEKKDGCLEVDFDGLPKDELQYFTKEVIAGKTYLKMAAGKYVAMSQAQLAIESSTPGLEIAFYDTEQGVNKNLKTVGFVPVPNCIRVRSWVFEFWSSCPACVQFLVTATNAGASWMIWHHPTNADSRRNFDRNWDYVPLIGHVVAQQGLPLLLTSLLVWDCFVHLILIQIWCQSGDIGEAADAANLMFLGNMFGRGRGRNNLVNGRLNLSRMYLAAFIVGPTLWLKISNLSLAMGTPQQNYAIFAVLMSFYLIIPLAMSGLINSAREFKRNAQPRGGSYLETVIFFVLPTTILGVFFLICGVHFFGVFLCGRHDLSILHGYTPMMSAES